MLLKEGMKKPLKLQFNFSKLLFDKVLVNQSKMQWTFSYKIFREMLHIFLAPFFFYQQILFTVIGCTFGILFQTITCYVLSFTVCEFSSFFLKLLFSSKHANAKCVECLQLLGMSCFCLHFQTPRSEKMPLFKKNPGLSRCL